jgi:polyisoprenyl-teichoic acid--peptidoglycan teichoic acid transferase
MRIPGWLFVAGLVALIASTALCSFLSFTLARDFVIRTRDSGIDLPSIERALAARPTDTLTPSPAPPTSTPEPGVTFTPVPPTEVPEEDDDPLAGIEAWNDPRRITVLVMGIDQRSAVQDTERAFRTDTMMLVQIDPLRKTAGVLSIPRDLYVNIPGFRQGRITMANYHGDLNELPGGGPALAMATVRANLGVRVDHYVRINFDVFLRVIETLFPNGVTVCIEEEIVDDKYPDEGFGFMTVRFEPGCQALDGERLLQFARTRATEGGDFDRNRRQQQVVKAVQSELLSLGGIANVITHIPALYTQLAENYRTNLSLDELLQLARLASELDQDDVRFGAISIPHVEFSTTDDGQQILIPRQTAIDSVVRDTFNPPLDLTRADLRQRAEDEGASIVIYNNTTISGLAGNTRDWFTSQGVTVSGVGSIDPPTNGETHIRDYTGKLWTARYLADLLGLPEASIRLGTDGLTSADVMVVVGEDVQRLLAE